MHVFQIKGLTGLLLFLVSMVALAALLLLAPSIFMMTLWNATVFEQLGGPAVDMGQGFLLWLMLAITVKIVLNPEISFQFKRVTDSSEMERYLKERDQDSSL